MLEQALILLTLLSFPVVALVWRKQSRAGTHSISKFVLGEGDYKAFVIASGISMSFVGGAATLNMASLGYQYGWSVLIDPLVVLVALIISASFAARVREGSGVTISEMLTGASPSLKIILGFTSFGVYQLLTAAQLVAVGKLLEPYFSGLPLAVLAGVPALIVLSYIYLRGFGSVTRTDVFQLLMLLVLFIAPVLWVFVAPSESTATEHIPFDNAPFTLLVYLALPLFFVPVSHDTNIRIKAASSVKHARYGLIGGGLLYALLLTTSVGIGVYSKSIGFISDQPESVLPHFFSNYLPPFGILATLAVLAAIISTLDSFAFDTIVSAGNDLLRQVKEQILISDKKNNYCLLLWS